MHAENLKLQYLCILSYNIVIFQPDNIMVLVIIVNRPTQSVTMSIQNYVVCVYVCMYELYIASGTSVNSACMHAHNY